MKLLKLESAHELLSFDSTTHFHETKCKFLFYIYVLLCVQKIRNLGQCIIKINELIESAHELLSFDSTTRFRENKYQFLFDIFA
jgi:hypothetical protein